MSTRTPPKLMHLVTFQANGVLWNARCGFWGALEDLAQRPVHGDYPPCPRCESATPRDAASASEHEMRTR